MHCSNVNRPRKRKAPRIRAIIYHELKTINKRLWNIEDDIRDKERHKTFDEEFIELARSVYITNDERARIKRNINNSFGSQLIEEKSYSDY